MYHARKPHSYMILTGGISCTPSTIKDWMASYGPAHNAKQQQTFARGVSLRAQSSSCIRSWGSRMCGPGVLAAQGECPSRSVCTNWTLEGSRQ